MREKPALDEMRIVQRLFERRHDGDAAVGGGEFRPPVIGHLRGDDAGDGLLRRLRIDRIVHQRRGQSNRVAEGEPELLLQRAAGDELAVARRIELIARRAAREAQFAGAGECPGRVADRVGVPGEGEHRVGHGDVEIDALPARVALAQAQQDVDDRRHGAAADVGNECRRHDGLLHGSRLERQEAGEALVVDVVAGFVRARPSLAVTRDRAINETRVDRRDSVIAEAEPLHHARPELLNQHVGARDQGLEPGAVRLVLEVEHHALLAAIKEREHRGFTIEARRHRAHVLPARPFDLDDLGAGLRQHQRRERARQQRGEVEDENAGERLHDFTGMALQAP